MKKIVFIICTLISISTFGQQEANVWYFGRNAGIDFNTTPPTAITNGALNTFEGCSSFSDASGNFLFYSDGITVWNKNHVIMSYTNGNLANNLRGNPSSTQSGMIIPKPGSTSIYYLFTVGDAANPAFDLYTIDMSLNGGLGQLIDEDGDGVFSENLAGATGNQSNWTEKVAAVKGADCNTFWVVSLSGDTYFSYLIDATGVNLTPVTSTVNNFSANTRGYLKLSPDGTKLAVAHQQSGVDCLLYSFDNSTGIVANDGINIFNNDGQAYGLEFSRSSQKLYLSSTSGFRDNLGDPPVTYKLFQFDLTASNILATQTLIHQESGFRGALQLGPDGKIYATIPQAYNDVNGDAQYLDAIENPNAAAVDIIFTQDAIFLNGQRATQGLPPFISSLLLPLVITESGSTTPLNDQTLNTCTGTDITFSPEPVSGSPNYIWTFDDGTTSAELSNGATSDLTLTNLTTAQSGIYTLTVTVVDACGVPTELTGEFTVSVFDSPVATQPQNMKLCDSDNNGSAEFPLTDQDAIIINGVTGMNVSYYLTQLDADAGDLAISLTSPYDTPSTTIYARIQNDANPSCYDTTSFGVEVYDTAFPSTTVSNLEDCDNTSVGTDIDGLIIFNLEDRKTEVLNGQADLDFTLTYFLDAAHTMQIPTVDVTNFTNTVIGGQTIYVTMTNNLFTSCATDSQFDIVVHELPVLQPTPPYSLEQCDDPSNDGNANFNLHNVDISVINPITTEIFTFYTSLTEAEAGIAGTEILNDTVYPVTGNTGTVWVRAENINGCFRTAQVNLTISPSSINPSYSLIACDDFLDVDGNDNTANDDTDGITTFNFQNEIDLILAQFVGTAGVSISCHHTQAAADANINPIDPATYSSYRNIVSPGVEQLWIRVVSNLGSQCLANGNFITLTVDPVPLSTTVAFLEDCDNNLDGNDTNGIGVEFNLESLTADIQNLQADFPGVNYAVTYHLTQAAANTGASPIPNSTAYPNTSDPQTIYVSVLNENTQCRNPHTTFELRVNPLPIVDFTDITLAPLCDDDSDNDDTNGIGVAFDLGSIRSDFLDLQVDFPAVNYTVTYHQFLIDAQAIPAVNPLPDLFANTVNNQSLFVRIENDVTHCIKIEEATNFLVVIPLPVLNPITVDPRCDDAIDGDDTNGIITWVLDDYIATFQAMQLITTDPYTVTFHSAIPATTGNLLDGTSYENASNPEPIFVKIINDTTGCFREIHAFDLLVNPLPEFEVNQDLEIVCENILPHEIPVENPTELYTYEWFDTAGNTIGTEQVLTLTDTTLLTQEGVTFTVTATNPSTLCQRTKEINVRKSSIATITAADITSVAFSSPRNSIEIITTNLGTGDYEFSLEHSTDYHTWQDEPIFTDLQGGAYIVLVSDKNGCGQTSLEVVIIDYPGVFTPNNDGENDTWQLIGLDGTTFSSSVVHIFDRFGKLVAQIPPLSNGWDGTYNGKQLPATDYWFTVELIDNITGDIKPYNGHFSLIRR